MTADLFDRYAALDPADTPDAAPDWASVAPVLLAAIERTTGMDTRDTTIRQETPPGATQQIEPPPSPKETEGLTEEKEKRRRSGALVGSAAFAVAVIAVGGVIPKQDYEDLIAAGASCIFGPGTVITTAAAELLDELDRRLGATAVESTSPT